MRKPLLLIIPGLLLGTMAFIKSNVFTDLQITEEEAKTEILNGLSTDDFYIPDNHLAKSLSPEARAIAVKALATFAKSYISSDAFLLDYMATSEIEEENYDEMEEELDMQFTSSEGYSVETQYSTLKETIDYLKGLQNSPYIGETEKAELKKQIELAEKELVKAEKEHKQSQVDAVREGQQKNRELYQQSKEKLKQGELQQEEAIRKQEEDKAIAAGESKRQLINKLEGFLAYTADIDFEAELIKGKDGKFYFADPELEAKDEQWKRFFRAGKEPVEAARQFATEWLKELK